MSFKSLFNVSLATSSRWIGPTPESQHNLDLELTKILYPRLAVRNSWSSSMQNSSPQPTESYSISDVSYSPDGKLLVAGSADHNVFVFDANTGKRALTVKQAHNGPVTCTCYLKDAQFVSGSEDSTIALWDIRKATEPMNILQGQTSCVRHLTYNYNVDMLLSSSMDSHVRYWHIPSFQSRSDSQVADSEDNASYRGILATCPDISHISLSPNGQWLVVVNTYGTMYIIYNLDVLALSQTLKSMRLDESLVMQLGWFNPNCSLTKKNRIRVLSADEYAPVGHGDVSRVSGVIFHPTDCQLLMRLAMMHPLHHRTSEWSCAINLQQSLFDSNWLTIQSYGSDILEETLMFSREEEKCGLAEKRHSFSKCGRVISSPSKSHLSLLAFSKKFDEPYTCQRRKPTAFGLSNLFLGTSDWSDTNAFVEVGNIQMPPGKEISCAKFSPTDIMLAVGDRDGFVHFYQPNI